MPKLLLNLSSEFISVTVLSLPELLFDFFKLFFFILFLMFIYLFWEKQRLWAGERQSERERENLSMHHAQHRAPHRAPSPNSGSWPELKSRVRHLADCATRGPLISFIDFTVEIIQNFIDFFEYVNCSSFKACTCGSIFIGCFYSWFHLVLLHGISGVVWTSNAAY